MLGWVNRAIPTISMARERVTRGRRKCLLLRNLLLLEIGAGGLFVQEGHKRIGVFCDPFGT
jgi:hypothetical protein